ncbi:SbcC/MukB-like Walker B domain-containing protein [Streptosporangium lutulentum]
MAGRDGPRHARHGRLRDARRAVRRAVRADPRRRELPRRRPRRRGQPPPVKTLSGGETFQASLALALALSAQLLPWPRPSAAQLESIFLDEGFGTLDETTLETVAVTLEELAARKDQMVGIVTHSGVLAERVPARFAVHRDQRTSSVRREAP